MSHPYPALARFIVQQHVAQQDQLPPKGLEPEASLWHEARACFVSIKTKDGSLRGCMGTILPTQKNLGKEIIANALSASSKDPRFPAVQAEELKNLVFSVDVLTVPEPVEDLETLDPAEWGVIVTKGYRRGLLLPDLDGVTSVEQQLSIAAQKAGLPTWHGAEIQRFRVDRYKETNE